MTATPFIAPPSGASHLGPECRESTTRSFLTLAGGFVGVEELPGFDHQALINMFRRELRLPADSAWDAAFVQHVGHRSHFDYESGTSSWPLPAAANRNDLCRVARELDLIRSAPEPADIFTVWSAPRRRFFRTGIVVSVQGTRVYPDGQSYYDCVTLEGNVNTRADRRGALVKCVRRDLSAESGDCFIRWADADASAARIRFAA